METIGTWWMWAGFLAIVLVMLAIDLFLVGGGKQHRVSLREAATWSGIWVGVSLLFAGTLWWYLDGSVGREVANAKTLEFVTGYLIEKSLAVDNVFVWLMLFSFFAIPLELQKRVLVLGVLGAIVMRTVMIFAGVWLIAQFHWLLYVFGAFLLVTGIKMWWFADEKPDLANTEGGIVDKPMPLHISKVALVDPKTKKATRIGYKVEGDKKVRIAKASGTNLG